MAEFLKNNWTYILAIGSVAAYLFEKGRTIWLDTRKRKAAYNRTFSAVLKLYLAYVSLRETYSQSSEGYIPEDALAIYSKNDDSLPKAIRDFETTMNKEADIVPEILLLTHALVDVLNRITLAQSIKNMDEKYFSELSDENMLSIKRAQVYALKDGIDEIFLDTFIDVRKKSTINKSFIKKLKLLNSDEFSHGLQAEQHMFINKYFESLNKQGVLPDELASEFAEGPAEDAEP